MPNRKTPTRALRLAVGVLVFLGITAVQPASAGLVKSGSASTYGPGYAGYLALPEGPGHRVTICGPGGCITRTSNDAGPNKAMQRQGRIADLNVADFEAVCGCPWTRGLVHVTVEYLGDGAQKTLPPTDTEGSNDNGSGTGSALVRAGQPLRPT
jgi:hypothetical protein